MPSGSILDSVFHYAAKGPYTCIRRENWVVYTFWNAESGTQELVVADMYEHREGGWLSRALKEGLERLLLGKPVKIPVVQKSTMESGLPLVVRQSFLLQDAVVAAGVTQSERAVTSRSVLLGLSTQRVLQIPKVILDPRRPIHHMTEKHRAELLLPFAPLLSTSNPSAFPGGFASSEHSIPWLGYKAKNAIVTEPFHQRESSCHALLIGLDVMYTVLSPAGKYDSLSDDFNYSAVVISCVIASVLTLMMRRYGTKKKLMWNWR